ncbi:hypothetical protein E2562_032813 [Oryza meyeriana var. granulata]|uniref:Uncharacterized protein n=1 Tax=Oryza meyeriana var. granulata TaxID=110450 RepID=A0A6G1DQW4_9ORYZ|nr:hypothetical protein E2562_032813 [Oryza meyeriana var. granulata]
MQSRGSRLTQPLPLHCPSASPADPHDPALLALVSGGRCLLRHGSRLTQPPPLHRPSAPPADPRDPALLTLTFSCPMPGRRRHLLLSLSRRSLQKMDV